ncbi:MAG TPA: 50S ribosomal protein L25 [Symbiobacteriaceae bacterium]|nr:50S ribosomal protein L25 [Symbiobacteriaceae bacterium]
MQLEPRQKGHSAVLKAKNSGKVPGVIYGFDGSSTPIQVPMAVLRGAIGLGGEHHPFLVQLQGQTYMAIIRSLERDLFTNLPSHFDLMPIKTDEPLSVSVPIRFRGEAELNSRGLLLHAELHNITLHGRPADLPEHVDLEVGQLKPGETVTVGDLRVPSNVTVQEKPGNTVVHVAHFRVRATADTTD